MTHEYAIQWQACAVQVLFTEGELAGRNFHYHFVVDRGMPYEVKQPASDNHHCAKRHCGQLQR